MGNTLSQFWPPAPKFTEKNVPDQTGKVFIVTGASSGVGQELTRLLYTTNATIYLATRTESKCQSTIEDISSQYPKSKGQLRYLHVDLEDLESVRAAAEAFSKKEERLDALWNNAGVMFPTKGSVTKQGYELQLGTNTLAHFLLVKLLTPLMASTAAVRGPGNVRVLWVASSAAELLGMSPRGGIDLGNLDYKREVSTMAKYSASKGGMALLNQEYAKQHKTDGIISVAMNPGNLKSGLQKNFPWFIIKFFHAISFAPVYGAYTELFSGFSPEITMENSGCWVIPFGRINPIREDIAASAIPVSEGGSDIGGRFWEWCEKQVDPYL